MLLHKDEINYKGINQEHHSFDEYNFNFIHSRTSNEVQIIFDAVKGLDDDIKFVKNHLIKFDNLIRDYKESNKKLRTLNSGIPLAIQQSILDRHKNLWKQIEEFPAIQTRLKIDETAIRLTEEKVKKIMIANVISSLIK